MPQTLIKKPENCCVSLVTSPWKFGVLNSLIMGAALFLSTRFFIAANPTYKLADECSYLFSHASLPPCNGNFTFVQPAPDAGWTRFSSCSQRGLTPYAYEVVCETFKIYIEEVLPAAVNYAWQEADIRQMLTWILLTAVGVLTGGLLGCYLARSLRPAKPNATHAVNSLDPTAKTKLSDQPSQNRGSPFCHNLFARNPERTALLENRSIAAP